MHSHLALLSPSFPPGAPPALLPFLLTPLLLGILTQLLVEPRARRWHTSLRKAPERPPAIAYPFIWTYCYLTLGYTAYLLTRHASALAYLALPHFLLLQSWQVTFLGLRDIRSGLRVMLALDASVPALLIAHARVCPLAAVLLLPYLAWLFVLTYTNWYMAEHNAGGGYAPADKAVIAREHARPAFCGRRRRFRSEDEAVVPESADIRAQ